MKVLLDTGANGYGFVDILTARALCEGFHIEMIELPQKRSLRGFSGEQARPITHAVQVNVTVQDHSELEATLFVTTQGQHSIILGRPWMNAHGALLDPSTDSLIFKTGWCHHPSLPKTSAKASGNRPEKSSGKFLKRRLPEKNQYQKYMDRTLQNLSKETKPRLFDQPHDTGNSLGRQSSLPRKETQRTKETIGAALISAAPFKSLMRQKDV